MSQYPIRTNQRSPLSKEYSLHNLYTMNSKLENQEKNNKKMIEKMVCFLSFRNSKEILAKRMEKLFAKPLQKQKSQELILHQDLNNSEGRMYKLYYLQELLTKLVAYYTNQLYSQKKENYQEMMKVKKINKSTSRNNSTMISFNQSKVTTEPSSAKQNQLEEWMRNLKELQRSHEETIVKTNSSQYQLSKKLVQVNTLRSERTIFNTVFDQFEKEYFNHELQYKQLVIERYLLDRSFEENVQQFQRLKKKTDKECSKIIEIHLKKIETERNQLNQSTTGKIISNNLDPSICEVDSGENSKLEIVPKNKKYAGGQSFRRTRFPDEQSSEELFSLANEKDANFIVGDAQYSPSKNSQKNSRILKGLSNIFKGSFNKSNRQNYELNNLQFQCKVKQIFEDLNIKGIYQIPQLIQNLNQKNQNLYIQAEKIYQQIYNKENFLQKDSNPYQAQLENKQRNTFKIYEEKSKRKIILQETIENLTNNQESTKKQIQQFCQKLKVLKTNLVTNKSEQFEKNSDSHFELDEKEELLEGMTILQQTLGNVMENSFINSSFNNHNLSMQEFKTEKCCSEDMQFFTERDRTNRQIRQSRNHRSTIIKQFNSEQQDDYNRLQQILKANKTTHNNMSIYTQEQFMAISKLHLSKAKKRKQRQSTLQFANLSNGIMLKQEFVKIQQKSPKENK